MSETQGWRIELRYGKWTILRDHGKPSEEGTQALIVLAECSTYTDADLILAALNSQEQHAHEFAACVDAEVDIRTSALGAQVQQLQAERDEAVRKLTAEWANASAWTQELTALQAENAALRQALTEINVLAGSSQSVLAGTIYDVAAAALKAASPGEAVARGENAITRGCKFYYPNPCPLPNVHCSAPACMVEQAAPSGEAQE